MVETLEAADSFASLRNKLRLLAGAAGEWAGIPMPIDGERLRVDPSYPFAEALNMPEAEPDPDPGEQTFRIVNQWWSPRKQMIAYVLETEDGKRTGCYQPAANPVDHMLRTLGAAVAWGVEQEQRALMTLARMVNHHRFKTYLLTGMFMERSKRSGAMYVFRRLRPTICMSVREGEQPRILATLCMHPIAYYEDSWAGAMCPTDDVIAHLALMRGDERMLWKRCSQHRPGRPESGIC